MRDLHSLNKGKSPAAPARNTKVLVEFFRRLAGRSDPEGELKVLIFVPWLGVPEANRHHRRDTCRETRGIHLFNNIEQANPVGGLIYGDAFGDDEESKLCHQATLMCTVMDGVPGGLHMCGLFRGVAYPVKVMTSPPPSGVVTS